jgi:lysophospholipase L1-like esterase
VRLSRNWKGTDCAYPGVEALADGTIVATTYGHWDPSQQPYVRSVRLTLAELDARAKGPAPTFARPSDAITPAPRLTEGWQKRMADDLAKAQKGGYEVVFVGDSITQGWNGAGKEQWASHWEPRKTLNLGVGGDRTQHVLWRLDHGALAALAGPHNAVKVCVVMIGTNNSNGSDNTAEEIGAGIAAVVQRLRAGLPQAKVLLLDVFPRGEKPNPQRQKNAAASDLAATAFAGDAMVRRLDLAPRFLQADGTLSKETMPDLLHLSPAAYRTWAEAMAPVVDELRR